MSYHGSRWKKFVDVSEGVDVWLQFSDDVCCVLVELERILNPNSEELGHWFLLKWCVVELQFSRWVVMWVECGVGCFGSIWDEVVFVEVGDKLCEVVLGVFL